MLLSNPPLYILMFRLYLPPRLLWYLLLTAGDPPDGCSDFIVELNLLSWQVAAYSAVQVEMESQSVAAP